MLGATFIIGAGIGYNGTARLIGDSSSPPDAANEPACGRYYFTPKIVSPLSYGPISAASDSPIPPNIYLRSAGTELERSLLPLAPMDSILPFYCCTDYL